MKYQKIYDRLISKAILANRSKSDNIYYESHHIIPKCMSGSNNESNLVLLTAREHFIAHKLLTKIHPHNNSLFFAYYAMANKNPHRRNEESHIKVSSREYERVRKEFSQRITGEGNPMYGVKRSISEETIAKRSGENHYNYGKTLSDATKEKIRNTRREKNIGIGKNNPMYGKSHSEEARLKVSLANKGKMAYNKILLIDDTKMSAKEATVRYNVSYKDLKKCLQEDNITVDLSLL